MIDRFGVADSFYNDYSFQTQNVSYQVRNRTLQRYKRAFSRRLWHRASSGLQERTRRLYRRVNTRARQVSSADRAALAELDPYFEPANRQLARACGIDLQLWA